jgi:hypothetical protein
MLSMEVGDWTVVADALETRRVHDSIAAGSPESCGCLDCRNFVAGRSLAYPHAALSLFEQLGMRPDRESEIGAAIDLGDARFLYCGFFHFVGRIVSGPPALVAIRTLPDTEDLTQGSIGRFDFRELEAPFGFTLRERRDLADQGFEGLPLVQLEFETHIPWLLSEKP